MDFFAVCQVFLIMLCKELKARLPLNNQLFKLMNCLDPAKAITGSTATLLPILSQFPHHFHPDDIELIDNEWRLLIVSENVNNIYQENPTMTVEEFWSKVGKIKEGESFKFKHLSKFAFLLLSLPISNSDCERIFSNVSLIKTKHRNRLSTATVSNLIITKEGLEGNCTQFVPDSEMLKAFNSDMYT